MRDSNQTCRRCGEVLPSGYRFCTVCGHDHEIGSRGALGSAVIRPMGRFGKSVLAIVVLWFVIVIVIWIFAVATHNPASGYDVGFGVIVSIAALSFLYPFFGVIIGLVTLIFSRPIGAGILAGTAIGSVIGSLACFAAIGIGS